VPIGPIRRRRTHRFWTVLTLLTALTAWKRANDEFTITVIPSDDFGEIIDTDAALGPEFTRF
jgi:hypothetical protein